MPYTLPREEEVSLPYAVAPDEPQPSWVVAALRQEYKAEPGITSTLTPPHPAPQAEASSAQLPWLSSNTPPTVLRATFKLHDT